MGWWTGRRIDGAWVGGRGERREGEYRRRRAALIHVVGWVEVVDGVGVWVIERLGGLVGDYSVTWPRSMPRLPNARTQEQKREYFRKLF